MTDQKAAAAAPVTLGRFKDLTQLTKPSAPAAAAAGDGRAPRAPLSSFVEDPDQPRTEFSGPEWDSFLEDVRQRGILQPVVVILRADGKLQIRFGARRLRAATVLALPDVPYVVQDDDERQKDDFAQVAENEQRAGLSPMEMARFVQRKVDGGMQRKDVAEKLHLDPSQITHLLSLASAPGFILEVYESGKCRQVEYLYDLRKLWEQNGALVEKRCSVVDSIGSPLINNLKMAIRPPAEPTKGSATAPKAKAPKKAAEGDTGKTSRAVAKKPLLYQGRPVSIVSCRMLVREQDGTEREIAGDALAKLLLTTAKR